MSREGGKEVGDTWFRPWSFREQSKRRAGAWCPYPETGGVCSLYNFITAQVRTHDDELHSLGTILVCVFCIFA